MSELSSYLMGTIPPGSSWKEGGTAVLRMKLQLLQQAWAQGRAWALHFRASQT